MVEPTQDLYRANAMPLGGRSVVFWLLAAAHVAFAASCSPDGVRSGDWSVPALPDPDCLVFVASGAIWVYPLILFPLWAGLGCGDSLLRITTTFLLCLAFVGAAVVRGVFRNSHAPPILPTLFVVATFAPMTLCFWWFQRFWKWRLVLADAARMRSRTRVYRPQFRLRRLLEWITLSCCLLALYRWSFPDGFPIGVPADWWQQIAIICWTMPLTVAVLLPAVAVPWFVLAVRGSVRTSVVVATSIVSCWVVFDCGLAWLADSLRLFAGHEILWIQLGASVASLMSALVLRLCGYRISHVGAGQSCPA